MNGETALNSKECRVDSDCDASQPHCINGWCRPCVEGEFLIKANNQFQCSACPDIGKSIRSNTTIEQCHRCGDNYYAETGGNYCAECTNTFLTGGITREECARCPNRCYDEETERCFDAEVGNVFNNNGICNYDCPAGQMFAQNDNKSQKRCAACPGIGRHVRYFSTIEQCHRCGDNYYAAEGGGRCGECTNTFLSAGVTREECARCPNRCYDEETGRCPICS